MWICTTKFKSSLINHLNRKNVCKATEDDVEIDAIKFIMVLTIHKILHQIPPKSTKFIHQNPWGSTNISHQNTSFLPQKYLTFISKYLKSLPQNTSLLPQVLPQL